MKGNTIMNKENYLTDVNDIFADDMKDPEFAKEVRANVNRMVSAAAIREERSAYGWTQKELAEKAHLPQSTIARIEKGSNTSMDTISKIAEAFGKTWSLSFS